MPTIKYQFDKEKNLWNIWDTCNYKSRWSKYEKNVFSDICEGKTFEECREELSEKFNKKIYDSPLLEIILNSTQEAWNNINNEFFSRLEKVMNRQIVFNKAEAYFTTIGKCPYDYELKNPSFFVPLFQSIPAILQVSAHEIMHIQFHNTYWENVEKEIGYNKTDDLKESLTVLLNLEFRDLWLVEDEGYESHQKLRKFISDEWKKEPDFDILMNKCVEISKSKMI